MAKEQISPVSFAQQRLMFLDRLDSGTSAYNLTRVIRVVGALDTTALAQTLTRIAQRQASLRTRFVFEAQDGYQIVDESVEFRSLAIDLSHLPEVEREPAAMRLAREVGAEKFDLAVAPLFRCAVIRLCADRCLLVLVMHHIVTDGWSMSTLFEEIGAIYEGLTIGTPARLADLSLQPADFARMQRETMTDAILEHHLNYWSNKLKGHEGFIELPTDRPRPAVQSHDGAIEFYQTSKDIAQSLRRLAESSGATLYMVLLAALQTLVWRYTGCDDILIGAPVAARNDARLEKLIGFFVNTLVMRGDLSGNPTFLELLRRTRATTLEALEHQDLPFEKLVEALNPPRNLSFTPLFQIMFILQNGPKQTLNLQSLRLEEIEFDRGSAMFDLTLEVWEQDGLHCAFEYCTALFDRTTIQRLARGFGILLAQIAEDADRPLSTLEILDEAERDQLASQFNSTRTDYRRDARIEQLFEQQVERTPDAIALIEGESRIAYRDLNARANIVAQALIGAGLNQHRPVGVYVERSIDAVVAFLAALKANTPYVPLDIANPRIRLEGLISDSGCEVVLTHRGRRGVLPDHVTTLSLDEPSLPSRRGLVPSGQKSSEDLAYIIYTSGSTGVPKGVEGRHRASINRFEWMWRKYPFSAHEICCAKSALGFVDSIWELFGPLLAGIASVIVPDDLLLELDKFVDLLRKFEVTRIVLTPSLLRALLDVAPDAASRLPKLTRWTLSGEVLPVDLAGKFRKALPEATLLNIYGSSEVTADVTCYEVNEAGGLTTIPIGKPIDNSQIYILDRYKNLTPPLVRGEIHVGGDCLARGYWRRPELTAQRFMPNPFRPDLSPALFATGDLGRIRADGIIEYFGRADRQIKLRGMRIEPGEIEANLIAHPQVREAAVAVQGDSPESRRLVAYIVKSDAPGPTADEIRGFLKSRVPQYMIPAMFVEIDKLQVLPSGKVDYLALPKPTSEGVSKHQLLEGGQTDIERKLSAIWQEVLDVGQIQVDNNFFDLGGHSLHAMRVLSRVRRDFQIEIPIRILFDRPTIAELALEVRERLARVAVTASTARQPSVLLSMLRAELSALPPNQFDAFIQSVVAERNARQSANS